MQHTERRWHMGLRASCEQAAARLVRTGIELRGVVVWLKRDARHAGGLCVVIVLAGFSLYPYMA